MEMVYVYINLEEMNNSHSPWTSHVCILFYVLVMLCDYYD